LPLTNTTDYYDGSANFTISNAWYVIPVTNGVEGAPGSPYGLAANPPIRQYIPIPLQTGHRRTQPALRCQILLGRRFSMAMVNTIFSWIANPPPANVNQYLQA